MANRIAFRVKMVGLPKTQKLLRRFGTKAGIARKKLLFDEGEATVQQARPFTPKKTGELRRSGLTLIKGDGVEVSFGGVKAPYALFVHEILTNFHKPPTKAKYLEDVFNKRSATMDTRFARELRSLLPETK